MLSTNEAIASTFGQVLSNEFSPLVLTTAM
jgi:hypothetical protein